jgi:hypothetical protein
MKKLGYFVNSAQKIAKTSGVFLGASLLLAVGCAKKSASESKETEVLASAQEIKTDEVKSDSELFGAGGESGSSLLLAPQPQFLISLPMIGKISTGASEHVIPFSVEPPQGVVQECAVTAKGVSVAANALWVNCTAGFKTSLLPNTQVLSDGHYDLHAKAKFAAGGGESLVVKKSFYVNSSLNNAQKCSEINNVQQAEILKEAKNHLIEEQFATSSDFSGPSLKFVFADGLQVPVSSLRRSVQLNSSKTLAILSRKYVSRKHGDCNAIRFRTPISGRNTKANFAVVSGSGACVFLDLNTQTNEVSFRGAFSREHCFFGRNMASRFSPKGLVGQNDTSGNAINSGLNASGTIGFTDE